MVTRLPCLTTSMSSECCGQRRNIQIDPSRCEAKELYHAQQKDGWRIEDWKRTRGAIGRGWSMAAWSG